jgi:molybdopterin-biosynthesis enzyme MoeA-like protein
MNFYQVIIGSEILNNRREDKHLSFLKEELLKRGFKLKASFLVEDDPKLIEEVFKLIKRDTNSVMFCFGGIGATPDDYTREIAAKVFKDGRLYEHSEAKRLIIEQFKEDAYPYRIEMAKLPKDAKLLKNVVNNVPGFFLEDRFFFTPGFPKMAHHMVKEALDKFFIKKEQHKRYTICVNASENDLMDIMRKIPKDVDFSSLPAIEDGRYYDVISISGKEAKKWIEFFKKEVEKKGFSYKEGERC